MDSSLGLYLDPVSFNTMVVRYNPAPVHQEKLQEVEVVYDEGFNKLNPPLKTSILTKNIVPLQRKYEYPGNYRINVIGEIKSIGYTLRSSDNLNKKYPLYGSGIYGVSCPYRLPDSTIFKLNNPLVLSNKTETRLAEQVFCKTLSYFANLKINDPRYAQGYRDKQERDRLINGWNILISLTQDVNGSDIHGYLKSDLLASIEDNWEFAKNPQFSHAQLWTVLKDLDNRLLPSPVTIIMTSFLFDGIVTLNPASTACVTGNVIYPPHTSKSVYGYL